MYVLCNSVELTCIYSCSFSYTFCLIPFVLYLLSYTFCLIPLANDRLPKVNEKGEKKFPYKLIIICHSF